MCLVGDADHLLLTLLLVMSRSSLGNSVDSVAQYKLHLHYLGTRWSCRCSPPTGQRNLWYLWHRLVARAKLVHERKVLSICCDTRVLNKYYLFLLFELTASLGMLFNLHELASPVCEVGIIVHT